MINSFIFAYILLNKFNHLINYSKKGYTYEKNFIIFDNFYTYINNFYLSILLLACYFCSNFFNRATASLVCSLSPKAVKRKNPSPFCPNPAPGVPTTWASLKR